MNTFQLGDKVVGVCEEAGLLWFGVIDEICPANIYVIKNNLGNWRWFHAGYIDLVIPGMRP
jgi:hypothetical protein